MGLRDLRQFFGCLVLLSGFYSVKAWTYHYNIDRDMDWTTARQWCQKNFTDMVAIQNQGEVAYLNTVLPFNRAYYWIGIRKIDGHWTWVGTKKRLVPEATNWATNEPNNQGSGEDCVEIYIKRRKDTAKWNDEKCSKKKAALCYLASCSEQSCSEHAECVETIGNYTCQCEPGFMGPRCDEVVQCPPVENPQQGFVECDGVFGAFQFNASCQFQCATGFKLEGAQKIHCLPSGHWDRALPVCQVVKCQPITDSSGGWSVNCTHPLSINSFNSSCEFKCAEGFELQGSDTTWCDHTGHWTQNTPTCTVVTCNSHSAPEKGHLTCADPLGKFSFQSSCNFTCDEGYKLRGQATLSCLSDGSWSSSAPVCEVVKCDPLKPTPHGSMHCYDPVEEFAYGSTCWFKCDLGFVQNGTNSTQCTKKGIWSHTPPVCQAIQCPPLPDAPNHGSVICTHPLSTNSYNSSCEFKCKDGFLISGAGSTHCDHTGHWTHKPPNCTVKRCGTLKPVQHGSVHCQDQLEEFSYGSVCWLECEAGFTLNGTLNSTYCTSQGKWSQVFPICQAQVCSPLSAPFHGNVTCTHPHGPFSFGTVCDVSCQTGFILHGTPQIKCLEMGKWSDTTPSCLAQQCPLLDDPENGWTNCSHPHSPFSYGSQCFVGCEPGFEFTGETLMECSASGNWSQKMPSCTAVLCEPLTLSYLPELGPPPLMNCSHPHTNFSFGSQCVFQCPESLELNGTSQLICTPSGLWTSSPPSCVVKEMSVGAGMLMFAAVGAASSAGLLLLGGLMFLLMRQFTKKAHYSLQDNSSEEGDLNPVFELNEKTN